MLIISCYITIIGILGILLIKRQYKGIYVSLAGILLFCIAAFRSINVGPDTGKYVDKYLNLPYESVHYFWNNFINGEGKDPFFYLFSKIISEFGAGPQLYIAILSGIFIYPVSRLIYKYSNNPYISYMTLIALGYLYFSFSGLRQALALSILICSYKYLRNRKPILFALLVMVASLFHSSALLFFIAYPLAYIKVGINHIIAIFAALIATFFFSAQIKYLIGIFAWNENLSGYAEAQTTLSFSGFIIQLLVYLFCLTSYRKIIDRNFKDTSLYNLLLLGLVFQAMATNVAEFFRISMYFSIFNVLLIPKAISSIKDKNLRVIVYLSIFLALLAYIFWTKKFIGLRFFWQEV